MSRAAPAVESPTASDESTSEEGLRSRPQAEGRDPPIDLTTLRDDEIADVFGDREGCAEVTADIRAGRPLWATEAGQWFVQELSKLYDNASTEFDSDEEREEFDAEVDQTLREMLQDAYDLLHEADIDAADLDDDEVDRELERVESELETKEALMDACDIARGRIADARDCAQRLIAAGERLDEDDTELPTEPLYALVVEVDEFEGNDSEANDNQNLAQLIELAERIEAILGKCAMLHEDLTAEYAAAREEIAVRQEQRRVDTIIPPEDFADYVRELAGDDVSLDDNAIVAIHLAAEAYLVEQFHLAGADAVHRGTETVDEEDLRHETKRQRVSGPTQPEDWYSEGRV